MLSEIIRRHQGVSRSRGVEYPEIDIREVWRELLVEEQARGRIASTANAAVFERLALEYEVRVNPVWPMPHLRTCLDTLLAAGMSLGIVSNSQFYTRQLFPALLGCSLEELGFSTRLQFLSYQFGQAKLGVFLYQHARKTLERLAVTPNTAICVGNDLLNDTRPAQQTGFRTALFAGDATSLRLRNGDARVADVVPDLVLTDLSQLSDCLQAGRPETR